jgi:hypothetical protein
MNSLTIYRSASPILTIQIDEKTKFSQKLMGEHTISAEFYASGVLPIMIGDYVVHNAHNYKMNRLPTITKLNNTTYQYKVVFEATVYDLGKKLFHSIDNLVEYGRTGNANDFLGDIINNMNAIDSGWTIGSVDSTEEKTIVFSNQSCWSALTAIAQAYGFEYDVVDKSISLKKSIGADTLYSFEYGRDNGLYKIERQQVQDQSIVTRVWGYGSTVNILETYRNRSKRLVFEERYLEKNIALYGIIEGQFTDNDIFPHRTAPLTAVSNVFSGNDYQSTSWVEDTTLSNASGFDLNAYFIKGTDPLIVFKSGDLAGQEFVIRSYDPATQRICFNPQSEEDGYTTPNPTNYPQPSDLYTLVNISQPQMYIDIAEASLKAKTQAFLDENSVPMVIYTLDIDPKFAKTNTVHLAVGDKVTVVDTALGVDNLIRISGLEYPLSNPYKMKAYIADFVPYTLQERVVKDTISQIVETRIVDRTSDELYRRYAMRQRQLNELIFDSDGYFDQERIRPLSVETMYLSVGARSQNFRLVGVTIMANYNGDPNRIYISSGELHHFEIPDEGEYVWTIGSALDQAGLDPDTPYYIYAVCDKMAYTGSWLVSASQLPADPVPSDGYYYFLVGIIYDVYEGVRDFDLTHGMTYINGRTITTGVIRSGDHQNFFDLDQNRFRIGGVSGVDGSLDWNVTTPNALTLYGALIQRDLGQTAFPITVFRGAWNIATVYHAGDMITYNGSTWIYINAVASDGVIPSEGEWWTLGSASSEGAAGASPYGMYRGNWAVGVDYYGNTTRRDIVFNEYDSLYYIAAIRNTTNPFQGLRPDLYPAYWEMFGANFESVATSFLFAENAHLDNVSVGLFEGTPVGVGDLSGTVATTPPDHVNSATPTNRIDFVAVTGTSGTSNITCGGITRGIVWQGNADDTLAYFYDHWYADYYAAGIMVETDEANDRLLFTGVNGENFVGDTEYTGSLALDIDTIQAYVAGAKQKETITLIGSGGSAWILCDGQTKKTMFSDTLTITATNFAATNYAFYYARNIILTSSGEDIIFEARYQGDAFTGATTITNDVSNYAGGINIEGNEIWDDKTANDLYGTVLLNLKGYNGGYLYYRTFVIGDGKGNAVLTLGGNPYISGNHLFMNIMASDIQFWNLPVSATGSGIYTDRIYRTPDGFIKIKN